MQGKTTETEDLSAQETRTQSDHSHFEEEETLNQSRQGLDQISDSDFQIGDHSARIYGYCCMLGMTQALNPGPEIINLDSESEDLNFPIEDFINLDDLDATFDGVGQDLETFQFGDIPSSPHLQPVQTDVRSQYEICLSEVLEIFPDISHDHVRQLYETWIQANELQVRFQEQNLSIELTTQILDAGKYPKEKDRINELKRKRSQVLNSDEEEEVQWKDAKRELDGRVYDSEA